MTTTRSCTSHRAYLRTSLCLFLGSFVALAPIAGCGGSSSGTSGGSSTVSTPKAAAPVVASISPTTVPVGSAGFTLTVTGSNFQPQAVVNWKSTPLVTTYVSASSLSAAVPASLAAIGGPVDVTVTNADGQVSKNILELQVGSQGPVLTSIVPATVTAGAPNLFVLLNGSNFVTFSQAYPGQTSTVQVNGVTVQRSPNGSPTSMGIVIPDSAGFTPGDVSITVTNPDGSVSNALPLHVISASNRVRTVNLVTTDIGWDAAHTLLVADSGSALTNTPNELVTIDPLQGTIVTTQPLPSSPGGISVTDDGSYVYVTLPSTGQVERLTLPSLTPDITFNLGNDAGGHFYQSNTVVAAPGHPHTVAITRRSSITASGSDGGVVIYDDGIARAKIAMPGQGNSYDRLVWGADATTLYGANGASSTGDEDTFAVDTNGVSLLSDRPRVFVSLGYQLAFDPNTSHLIDSTGNVVDAGTGLSAGLMRGATSNVSFALDFAQRRAFFVDVNGNINAFDIDHFNFVNSLHINNFAGGSKMVRWGSSGLAMAGNQVSIVDGSFVAPTGVSSAVGGYAAPTPTLTTMSPTAVMAGSPDTQLTLTGRDFTQSAQVTWNNQALSVNSISDTQIVATVPAAMLANGVASELTVTNGPGTNPSDGLAFTVLPNLGASVHLNVLNLSGQDMAWDSTHGLIYVAVPSQDPIYPNSIAVIDPSKQGVQQTVPFVQPSAISLSDDGQYLYVGSFAKAIVQRYSVPSFSPDLTISSGAGSTGGDVGFQGTCTFAVDIEVAPGSPHTIAVANGMEDVAPQGCGPLAIYDDATPRSGTLPASNPDYTRLAWGADASFLFALTDSAFQSQTLSAFSVDSSGVSVSGKSAGAAFGTRPHYDRATGLIFTDAGVILNPTGLVKVGTLPNGTVTGRLTIDDSLQRIFLLTADTTSGSGQGASSYTLEVFDLPTRTFLGLVTVPNVLGYPTQMVRWGSDGIAFVTKVTTVYPATHFSQGVLYMLQGKLISGAP